jgi:hypothetical protein
VILAFLQAAIRIRNLRVYKEEGFQETTKKKKKKKKKQGWVKWPSPPVMEKGCHCEPFLLLYTENRKPNPFIMDGVSINLGGN